MQRAQKVSRASHPMMGKGRVPEGDHVLKQVKKYHLLVKQIMGNGGDVKVLLVLQMRISVGMAVLVTVTKVLFVKNMALEALF